MTQTEFFLCSLERLFAPCFSFPADVFKLHASIVHVMRSVLIAQSTMLLSIIFQIKEKSPNSLAIPRKLRLLCMVGVARFELAASWTPFKHATKLRYTPNESTLPSSTVYYTTLSGFVNSYFSPNCPSDSSRIKNCPIDRFWSRKDSAKPFLLPRLSWKNRKA